MYYNILHCATHLMCDYIFERNFTILYELKIEVVLIIIFQSIDQVKSQSFHELSRNVSSLYLYYLDQ